MKKLYLIFFVTLFALAFTNLAVAAELEVFPSIISPGDNVTLTVSGVERGDYYCIYVNGTPAQYNGCNASELPQFSASGENKLTFSVPQDVLLQNYEVNVGVFKDENNKNSGQILKGLLRLNTAEAQGMSGQLPDAVPPTEPSVDTATKPPVTASPQQQSAGTAVNCETLGLKLDPETNLCLPENLVKGPQDSLAGSRNVGDVIKVLVRTMLVLAGAVAVLFIMIGGYQFLMSRGSEEMAKKGRSTLTMAIIGLILILLAWTIVNLVTNAVTTGSSNLF